MNPHASELWRAPRWALAILLALLGMLGPFSIDTYLPAFSGIASSLNATPAQMQQTLSAYLFGFAFMNLFHGALSDSIGRRPVVLTPSYDQVRQPIFNTAVDRWQKYGSLLDPLREALAAPD